MSNPFRVPGPSLGIPQQNRRERFKKVFIAVLAAHVVLFLTLLIQGCRTEQQHSQSDGQAEAALVAQN